MRQLLTFLSLLCCLQSFSQGKYYLEWEFWQHVDTNHLGELEVLHATAVNLDSLPDAFYTLSSLVEVHIDAIGICRISPKIEGLQQLERFSLVKSRISVLPAEIGKLQKLKELNISGGGMLRSVPPEIGDLQQLESLNLWRNELTTLPASIAKLKNLKTLNLIENNFSKEERKRIQQLLPNCKVVFDY